MLAHSSQMNGDGDPPGLDLEEGVSPASPRHSMAGQRRRAAATANVVDTSTSASTTTLISHEQTPLSPKPSHNDSIEKSRPPPAHHRSSSNPHGLITYAELPEWYRDNEYILGSYRRESRSWVACLRSLLYLHNESVNIYTHLLPSLACIAAQGFLLHSLSLAFEPHIQTLDYVMFSFYLVCASVMFGLSTAYHTLMSHSRNVSFLWLRMDYLGILLSILGSFVSGIRMGFYCDPKLQKVYWSMSIFFTAITSVLVIHPKYFQGHKYRRLRIMAFMLMGFSALIPVAHGIAIYGAARMWAASGLPYYLGEGGLIAVGAVFYSTRCPESVKPGKFDVWGCSHSIFHILVVMSTGVHMMGLWKALAYNFEVLKCGA